MEVLVINSSNNDLPQYETSRSAGADVRCAEKWDTEILPGGTALVSTGLFVSIPQIPLSSAITFIFFHFIFFIAF